MLDRISLQHFACLALREDLASGDLTTDSTVRPDADAVAVAIAKQSMVVCGGPLFAECFRTLDPEVAIETLVDEGQAVHAGEHLWVVRGKAAALLKAERSALNYAQRLSGISTLTRLFVAELPSGSRTRITDTRKTTPGLRPLERYAVRVGGGFNHRDNLGSAVLIKDNHIEAAGGIARAVDVARRLAPHTAKIEVEVENPMMLEEALRAGADIVMLDNFRPEDIAAAVKTCAGRALVEVSGNITIARVAILAAAGVDVMSVGALTHSAPAADISLRFSSMLRA